MTRNSMTHAHSLRLHLSSSRKASGRLWRERESGIALLLVMIVFIVLYLVVYQLQFSTTMEEKLADVRSGDVEGSIALHSMSLYVMTLLMEDLRQDLKLSLIHI